MEIIRTRRPLMKTYPFASGAGPVAGSDVPPRRVDFACGEAALLRPAAAGRRAAVVFLPVVLALAAVARAGVFLPVVFALAAVARAGVFFLVLPAAFFAGFFLTDVAALPAVARRVDDLTDVFLADRRLVDFAFLTVPAFLAVAPVTLRRDAARLVLRVGTFLAITGSLVRLARANPC
ncbi:MAG: hypothetical protein ACYS0G_14310 [Planctomycetota bacterium]